MHDHHHDDDHDHHDGRQQLGWREATAVGKQRASHANRTPVFQRTRQAMAGLVLGFSLGSFKLRPFRPSSTINHDSAAHVLTSEMICPDRVN
jgi:hypothetical protein